LIIPDCKELKECQLQQYNIWPSWVYWKMSEVFGQFENFSFTTEISENFVITSSDYRDLRQ